MSESKPCPCVLKSDLGVLNDRILNLGAGLATMPENGTMQVSKVFLTAVLGYMEELLCMRRAQPANEPLTLDELRGMDGEPVWVHRLEDNQGWWVVIKSTERDKVTTDYGGYFEFADYGKTWLAYRRPPERSENE